MEKPVWIGLAHAIPNHKNTVIKRQKGAWVNVAACADSEQEFTEIISLKFEELEFTVVKIEDIAVFKNNIKKKSELKSLARFAESTKEIQSGTFFSYSK